VFIRFEHLNPLRLLLLWNTGMFRVNVRMEVNPSSTRKRIAVVRANVRVQEQIPSRHVHRTPQAPQFWLSVQMLVSQPLSGSPSQSNSGNSSD
jgi:hypothetical protein